MLDCAIEQIERNRATIEIARNASDIDRIRRAGKIAAVLDIEGSFDLDGDLGVLRDMYRLGLRSVQLSAHNWTSNYADSCCSTPKWHGINEQGRAFIHEMNRLGMVINVSHASDEAISQAIDVSSRSRDRDPSRPPRRQRHPPQHARSADAEARREGRRLRLSDRQRVPQSQGLRLGRGTTPASRSGTPAPSQRAARCRIAEIDKLVAPQFPMLPVDLPDDIRMTVDDWVARRGPRHRHRRRGPRLARQRLRRRTAAARAACATSATSP